MYASDRRNVLCWTWVIAQMPRIRRRWSHGRLRPMTYICNHLRSTEDICRINCVHRTDIVRLVAISGISVVNWSHKCDHKYSSYEFSAFTCNNLSQPSVTYRNPSVTNALAHSEWRPKNIYSQEEINLYCIIKLATEISLFHYKSVKLDVLCRQNKIWKFGNPFQSKKLPIFT